MIQALEQEEHTVAEEADSLLRDAGAQDIEELDHQVESEEADDEEPALEAQVDDVKDLDLDDLISKI